jgi:hypothetical protein
VSALPQLMQAFVDDLFQGALPSGQQEDTDLSLIASAACAADITVRLQPINQTDGAVMPEEQTFREAADAGVVVVGKFANGKKHLVLLWFEAGGLGGIIAAAEKAPDTIAQFGECGVFGVTDFFSHFLIISHCDINASANRCFRHPGALAAHLIQ